MLVDTVAAIIEIPDSTQQPKVLTWGQMKKRVANRLNGGKDAEMLEAASDALLWAVSFTDITTETLFGVETRAAVAINEGDETIDLTANYFGVRQIELLYTAESIENDQQVGDIACVVPRLPYERFSRLPAIGNGPVPLWWSARNTFTEPLRFWPRADADAAADWTFRVIHYTPIGLPDSDTDILAAPQAFTQVLTTGATAYLLKERRPEDRAAWEHEFGLFDLMINRNSSSERRRHGQDTGAWTIGDPA